MHVMQNKHFSSSAVSLLFRLGQGRRQKIFQGGGGQSKKYRKIAKKTEPKNTTIKALPGGGHRKKRPKNSTILSLYLLYLYHV